MLHDFSSSLEISIHRSQINKNMGGGSWEPVAQEAWFSSYKSYTLSHLENIVMLIVRCYRSRNFCVFSHVQNGIGNIGNKTLLGICCVKMKTLFLYFLCNFLCNRLMFFLTVGARDTSSLTQKWCILSHSIPSSLCSQWFLSWITSVNNSHAIDLHDDFCKRGPHKSASWTID